MSVSKAYIFILIVLRPEISDPIAKHFLCIILIEHEEQPRVLAILNHLIDHAMGIIRITLILLRACLSCVSFDRRRSRIKILHLFNGSSIRP